MKLSEHLESIGRSIAYYPALTAITGGVTETVFICQFAYWTGRQDDHDGWIYKTQDDIRAETGLSRSEQETARKHLREKGLLEEKYEGLPCRLFYRINKDGLDAAWALHLDMQACGNAAGRDAEKPHAIIRNTEITTEITHKSNLDASATELEILNVLNDITNYRFDQDIDLNHIRRLAKDYPRVDLLRQVKKWRDYKIDKPLDEKSHARSQFRTWVEHSLEYDVGGLKVEPVAHVSQHDILFGKSA